MVYQIVSVLSEEILFYLVLCTLLFPNYRKYYVPAKMICSTGYMVILVLMGWISGNTDKFLLLLPVFGLYYLGDLFLGFRHTAENKKKKTQNLYIGTISFFVGQIILCIELFINSKVEVYDFVLVPICVLAVIMLSRKEVYDVGKFLPIGIAYAVILALIVNKSITNVLVTPMPETIIFMIGSIMFIISDFLVFVMYFRKTRAWPVHGLNLLTYYFAVSCYAITVFY